MHRQRDIVVDARPWRRRTCHDRRGRRNEKRRLRSPSECSISALSRRRRRHAHTRAKDMPSAMPICSYGARCMRGRGGDARVEAAAHAVVNGLRRVGERLFLKQTPLVHESVVYTDIRGCLCRCLCTCLYTYVYAHVHAHAHAHVYTRVNNNMSVHISVHISIHTVYTHV